jgi:hypothetical protein
MRITKLAAALTLAGVFMMGVAGCSNSNGGGSATAPTGLDDVFATIGNATLVVPGAQGLITNDEGSATSVTAYDAVSVNGATVVVDTDGGFTYTPLAGDRNTTDLFTYTVENSGGSDTASVTINITDMVWWIDNSVTVNGDGTQAAPFDSIASAAAATDLAGDVFYLATGAADYEGNLVLLDDQQLIGGGAALVVNTQTLESAGTAPNWTAIAGDALTLAANNVITGLDFGNTPTGFAIVDGGLDCGNLQLSDVTILGEGGAISLTNGCDPLASVTIDGIASTSAPNQGVVLDGFVGTFQVTGATVMNMPVGNGVQITNCPSGSITFDTINITNYAAGAVIVDTVLASFATDTITIGINAGGAADAVFVNDVDNCLFGDIIIENADESGVSIASLPVGQTLGFGDITLNNPVDDYGLEVISCAGTLTFGSVVLQSGAVTGNPSVWINGLTTDGSITFMSTNAPNGIQVVAPAGTIDFGATDCDAPILVDSPTAATITFAALDLDSATDGLLLTNGDGLSTIALTTIPADISAVGTVLRIQNYLGTDGTDSGWNFGSVSGTGVTGIDLDGLQDDFTVVTGCSFTSMSGPAISIANSAAVSYLFGGTTVCGAANPNQVNRGVVLTNNDALATFEFASLSIDAILDGFTADAGVIDFSGTAPTIFVEEQHALSLANCVSNSGTWAFGDITSTGLNLTGENVVELLNCTANFTANGVISATTATGLGGDVLHVDNFTGNVSTVGLVSVSGLNEDGAEGIHLNIVTGDVTLGPVDFDTFSGADAHGIFLSGITGNVSFDTTTVDGFSGLNATGVEINNLIANTPAFTVTFGGGVTVTSFTGGTNRGIEISNSTCDIVFNAPVNVNTFSAADSYGVLVQSVVGNIGSALGAGFQIDGVDDSTSVSVCLDTVGGDMNFFGDFAFVDGTIALQLLNNSGVMNFVGAVDISGNGFATGIYFSECDGADIDFNDLFIVLDSDAGVAIDLRGANPGGSNVGATFTVESTDANAGIEYVSGNATAIWADQLAALEISGQSGADFQIVNVGTGTIDGAEGNIVDGPHGVYATDCEVVNLQFVNVNTVGDTTTDGNECALYISNATVAPTAITVAGCTLEQFVDGHGIYLENEVATSNPTMVFTSNILGDVFGQNANCWGMYLQLDGVGSANILATDLEIRNQGNFAVGTEGGIFLELLNGAGSVTPVVAAFGDNAGNQCVVNNVYGNAIDIDCLAGSNLSCTLENWGFAVTTNPSFLKAIDIDVTADALQTGNVDLVIDNCFISGYTAMSPVDFAFDGATNNSDVKFQFANSTFASCSPSNPGLVVSTSNDCFNGGTATGVFDVLVENNQFTTTAGFESVFTGTDESLLSLGIVGNTWISDFTFDRDSGDTNDHLIFGDALQVPVASASQLQVEDVLIAAGGNNNTNNGTAVVFNFAGSSVMDIVDIANISEPTEAP